MLFFGAHTLNGQLEDREEHFAEFENYTHVKDFSGGNYTDK